MFHGPLTAADSGLNGLRRDTGRSQSVYAAPAGTVRGEGETWTGCQVARRACPEERCSTAMSTNQWAALMAQRLTS